MSEPRSAVETEPVPDGSLALSETRDLRVERRSAPGATPRAPDGTQHVPDGTQHVPDAAQPGSGLPRFGRFQAQRELGAGAMGTVYQATDDVLGRAVAIKTLHAQDDSDLRERFLREARAIGAVHHPHILAIYSAGTEGDTPYLVMELASAGSLRDRIKAGPMPADSVRTLGIQIARALAAAHALKILHRDVKPANILCAHDGAWKLADFGIARLPDSTLTVTGQFLGSPSYAAPESLRAGEFSPAADVYGLGATLYEALTGAPPYGDHDMQSLVRKLEEEPPPLRGRIAVPAALGDAIMATLARDPASRPSAEQVAVLLASSPVAEAPARAVAVALVPEVAPPRRRALVIAGVVAAALLLLLLVTRGGRDSAALAKPPGAPLDGPLGAPAIGAEPVAAPADDSTDPGAPPEPSEDPNHPTVVDQYGNPVDEETARRVLEQIERDQRTGAEPGIDPADEPGPRGRGRGRGKRKYRDD